MTTRPQAELVVGGWHAKLVVEGYPLVPYKETKTEACYLMENGLAGLTQPGSLAALLQLTPPSVCRSFSHKTIRRPYRVFAERSDRLATVQPITCACACSRPVGADYSLVDLRLRACPTC